MSTNRKSSHAMSLRKKAGLSQTAVAAALMLTEQTVRNWESGRSEPRLAPWQTQKLLELYKCNIDDLVAAFPRQLEETANSEDPSAPPKIPVAS